MCTALLQLVDEGPTWVIGFADQSHPEIVGFAAAGIHFAAADQALGEVGLRRVGEWTATCTAAPGRRAYAAPHTCATTPTRSAP